MLVKKKEWLKCALPPFLSSRKSLLWHSVVTIVDIATPTLNKVEVSVIRPLVLSFKLRNQRT